MKRGAFALILLSLFVAGPVAVFAGSGSDEAPASSSTVAFFDGPTERLQGLGWQDVPGLDAIALADVHSVDVSLGIKKGGAQIRVLIDGREIKPGPVNFEDRGSHSFGFVDSEHPDCTDVLTAGGAEIQVQWQSVSGAAKAHLLKASLSAVGEAC